MRFRQAALIYNPASGRKRVLRRKRVERSRRILTPWVRQVDLRPTEGPGDATRLAVEALAEGADLIAVCGGDGTINEVIGGMADSSASLLVLPAGTANVLADEVGLPMEPEEAAGQLPRLVPCRVPLGVVRYERPTPGSRHFLLMCGVGVDASIVYNLDTRLKSYLGQGAYWLGSLERLQQPFEPFLVRLGDQVEECTFALFSKSRRYGGGLVLTPRAHLLAGQFEAVLFRSRSALRYMGYLAQIATGTLERIPDVSFHFTNRAQLSPKDEEGIYIEVDGELAGRIPAVVETAAESVTVLLPPEYAEQGLPSAEPEASVSDTGLR